MRPYVPAGPPRFAHQRAGLRKLIETKGVCALLFDPGTGKTATTLDYLSVLALASRREIRVLVLAPKAATDTWVLQAQTYVHPEVAVWAEALGGSILKRAEALNARGPSPDARSRSEGVRRAEALYTRGAAGEPVAGRQGPGAAGLGDGAKLVLCSMTLDALKSRAAVGSRTTADVVVRAVRRFQPDVIVIDESHRIKGATSNVSRAAARLTELSPRRILLTGTVMPHSPLDVWAQWRFLQPMAFQLRGRPMSYGNFKAMFGRLGGWMGKEVVGFQRLDEMEAIMAKNSIVAKKADCLDLPPTTDVLVPVHLTAAEQRHYTAMKDQLAIQFSDGSFTEAGNRLTQLMRLRQITSGFVIDDDGNTVTLGSSKVDTIASIVNDSLAGENRVVVFSQFLHEVERIASAVAGKGTRVEVITGSTKQADRQQIRARFGSDDPQRIVLVAQIRTLSLAVNELVTSCHAVFGTLSQQRDDYIQARDRLDRQGQKRPVTFWITAAPKTVDQVVLTSHRQRTNLEAAMLAHINSDDEIEEAA